MSTTILIMNDSHLTNSSQTALLAVSFPLLVECFTFFLPPSLSFFRCNAAMLHFLLLLHFFLALHLLPMLLLFSQAIFFCLPNYCTQKCLRSSRVYSFKCTNMSCLACRLCNMGLYKCWGFWRCQQTSGRVLEMPIAIYLR